MINLFDKKNQETLDLHHSLRQAGFTQETIVLEEDGWLPENMESPFSYFIGYDHQKTKRPLYFNQVKVPELWEISGSGTGATIQNYDHKMAEIEYALPREKRQVKSVKWFDRSGRIRSIDHYTDQGWRFSQDMYNTNGELITTTYYTESEQEVIVVNHVTNDILLNRDDKIYNFQNMTQFVVYYLGVKGYTKERIFYNSLSYPFFVTLALKEANDHVLFWQEPLHDAIPMNMQMILNGQSQTEKIVFCEDTVYQKALTLWPDASQKRFYSLGYLFPREEKRSITKEALILTNSDQIAHINMLVQNCPEMQFNIAAHTEMSRKLLDLNTFNNVQLYPNVSQTNLEELWQKASYYLDINYQSEVDNAVRTAFEKDILVLAFKDTAHHAKYTHTIYTSDTINEMVAALNTYMSDSTYFKQALKEQRKQANEVTVADYHRVLS